MMVAQGSHLGGVGRPRNRTTLDSSASVGNPRQNINAGAAYLIADNFVGGTRLTAC